MPTINQLPVLNTISSGDQLPVYSPNNGDARRTSIGSLLTFFQQSFASPTLAVNLFVPGSGFNITVPTPVSEGQWMLLQPAGSLATGTITLPLNTGVPDGTTVLITSTQNIASLTIALNGASAIFGAVTSLTAGSATALRFYQPTNSWYQITAVIPDLASGIAAWLANPTSANLRAAMTDETGTGLLVFNNNPALVAPDLGIPVAGILTNCTGLPNAGLVNSSLTIGGTAIALGTASSTIANDVTFNGVTVGRGLTSEATNTALGNGTLGAVTTATDCTAVGASALFSNTTGERNTAVGTRALVTNTTGVNNVAVGVSALDQNLSGNSNIAVGRSALLDNTSGSSNVALGTVALSNNTSGTFSIGIGLDSLFNQTTGVGNIAIGRAAQFTQDNGVGNIAIGASALYSNVSGLDSVAIGVDALFANVAGNNVAIGSSALRNSGNAPGNTAIGYEAMLDTTTGQQCVALGYQSLANNTTASNNTAIGYQALITANGGANNTAVGHIALIACTTGRSNTGIGKSALGNVTTGSGNTAISPYDSANNYAPVFDPTTEDDRVCMGSTSVTNAYVQVPWTVVSDARDKTDFAPVPHGLDFVSKLKPIAYRYKKKRTDTEGHGPMRYGFKAQEVLELEGAAPVIVDAENDEKLRFNDQSMIAVLVNAIQELKAEFEAYKSTHP